VCLCVCLCLRVCVRGASQTSYARVKALLQANSAQLALLAEALLKHEVRRTRPCRSPLVMIAQSPRRVCSPCLFAHRVLAMSVRVRVCVAVA
jgi:hypothetical protein